jgi:hypothetical protein
MRGREVRSCVAFWCSSIIATETRRAFTKETRHCNMAPNKPHDSSLDSAHEHEEFLDTLEAYHEKRG